jgi:hypothetical protein
LTRCLAPPRRRRGAREGKTRRQKEKARSCCFCRNRRLKERRHWRAITRQQKEKTDSGCFATTLSVFPLMGSAIDALPCAAPP